MFPSAADQPRPTRRSLGEALRDAADLTIALLTLESYGLEDLRPALSVRPHRDERGALVGAATTAHNARLAAPMPDGHRLSTTPTGGQRPPLRAASRTRRPGSVDQRQHLCLSPLEPRPPTGTTLRRRPAPQDAPR